MLRCERLAVVMRGQQNVIAMEICERNVGGITLLCVYEYVRCVCLRSSAGENFAHSYSLPGIVEAAPARYAMEIAGGVNSGELIELSPRKPQRVSNKA